MRLFRIASVAAFALITLGISGCASTDTKTYVVEEQGRSTLSSAFSSKKDAPAEQWEYACQSRDKGSLQQAESRMRYLYRRWPNSKEAPWAMRAQADMLFERGKWKESFKAYQLLIDSYPGRMEQYDEVLEHQFEIAIKIMNHKRMRWLFGGYKAPEYAVDYFESIIRNGPQWSRAPEAQFMIGKCNQDAKQYELAVSAYGILGYRYPDSSYAEEAAWQQVQCLSRLRKEFPNSPEVLDRMLTATTVFLSTFPQSQHKTDIIQMRNDLYEVKARRVFEEAEFYADVPKEPEAALRYYEKMVEEYSKSQLVPEALARIEALKILLAKPIQARVPETPRSRPLPFTKGMVNAQEG